jgi:hypothetical protein
MFPGKFGVGIASLFHGRMADHLYGGFAFRQSTINGADRVGIYPYFSKLYLNMLIGSGDCLGMAVCSRETALRYTSVD